MAHISGTQKTLGIALLLVLGAIVIWSAINLFPTASNQGYAPEQPIPFSHRLHAGDNKIPCAYCHVGVERSKHASVPSVGICMNCHSVVKTDSPWIQKIKQAYQEGKPIEWVRVHELPDYVYFPHKRHIAKGIACETCHGDVKKMERIEQTAAMTMGWCMECHRGQTAPSSLLRRVRSGEKDLHGPIAPVNCSTCHH